MNKRVCAIVMTGILTLSMLGTAAAIGSHPISKENVVSYDTAPVSPRAEQTEWYYQFVDGKWQKRLWSITEGMWLTDWMDVEQ